MFIRLLVVFIIFLVSACNEKGSEQSEASSTDATAVPDISSLTTEDSGETGETAILPEVPAVSTLIEIPGQTEAGLKGIDDNANGIRDDIDQLIAQKFSYTSSVKRAAEQEARALQKFMETTTKEAALQAAEQIARATRCTFKVLPDPIHDYDKRQALSTELEAWTVNTQERLTSYLASSKLIGGSYFMQPIEPVCD